MSEKNKERYAQMIGEVWDNGNLDVIDEYYAPDVVIHNALLDLPTGRDAVAATVGMFVGGLSDLKLTAEFIIGEGDLLAVPWTMSGTHTGELLGVPATGKAIKTHGISVVRFEGGKVVEIWGASDQLSLMQQLGAIPT